MLRIPSMRRQLASFSMQQMQVARMAPVIRSAPSRTHLAALPRYAARSLCTAPGQIETMEFQAETRKLLDIVTNSIYTDKEVFIRELISNASDALEKYRYNQVKGSVIAAAQQTDSEIHIFTDEATQTLTILDTGIGMTKAELISNLGTIARSGSKAFSTEHGGEGIIGQFGVGFYASFMVADHVTVESISALSSDTNKPYRWSSEGTGVFAIEDMPSPPRIPGTEFDMLHGTKITLKLKGNDFASANRIENIVKKYSGFVSYPVKLNGKLLNTSTAIWVQSPSALKDDDYSAFYQHLTGHMEKFGMGRMEKAVSLYSRKVLIDAQPKNLLPDWCRFLKGVVDSADLPLSLSRETSQDSALVGRIQDILVRKFLRFLADEQKKHPATYLAFYSEYNMFLKEGLCSDYKYMELLAKLLMFETSGSAQAISLDEYISQCPPEQKDIYYLVASNRAAALSSPYYEYFKKHNIPVLLLFNSIDQFVMSNLKAYMGRKLISAEESNVMDKEEAATDKLKLNPTQSAKLCSYLSSLLGTKVRSVKVTQRLSDSPAIITDHESGAVRRMMRMMEEANVGKGLPSNHLPPQQLEVNPSHPLIMEVFAAHEKKSPLADVIAQQVFDNALLAAGLLDDPKFMLPRLQEIMLMTLRKEAVEEAHITPVQSAAVEEALHASAAEDGVKEAEFVDSKPAK